MKKYYSKPEIEVRNYVLSIDEAITTSASSGDLDSGPDYDGGGIL